MRLVTSRLTYFRYIEIINDLWNDGDVGRQEMDPAKLEGASADAFFLDRCSSCFFGAVNQVITVNQGGSFGGSYF